MSNDWEISIEMTRRQLFESTSLGVKESGSVIRELLLVR